MEQEEQFASRKNIQKSSNFLIQGKNKKNIQGQWGTKMTTRAEDCTMALADNHSNPPS
jgi:hypothetical protein